MSVPLLKVRVRSEPHLQISVMSGDKTAPVVPGMSTRAAPAAGAPGASTHGRDGLFLPNSQTSKTLDRSFPAICLHRAMN